MSDDGALVSFGEGVWMSAEPVSFLGMRLTANMTLLRLGDDTLLAHSPVALTPARRAAVDALGKLAHLYAPNLFHHTWLGQWSAAYPSARVHAPPGLARKRRDLRIDRGLDGRIPEPALAAVADEVHIDGFRLEETALFYRPATTLVVADLVHNIGRPEHAWTKFYTRVMGFHDRVALSRMIRWTAFSDRKAVRRSLNEVLAHPFERLIVGHGPPLVEGGREALTAAYRWLPDVAATA